MNVQWMRLAIMKNCDMYLSDLQDILEQWVGQRVSQATVWRTLKRLGFTMKLVRRFLDAYLSVIQYKPGFSACN